MVDIYEQNPLQRLYAAGQSVWYDNIRRGLVLYGELEAMVAGDAVTGITSNPSIFHKAVTESAEYDPAIADLAREGLSPREAVDILMAQDIQLAADVLRPVWEGTHGKDGWVSIEVAPSLAHDAAGTVADAQRLAYMVDRPNVLVKVPATSEGVEAIRTLVGRGACINVTLIFALERHVQVMEAYMAGLEELAGRVQAGEDVPPLSAVAGVASFFVSRLDTLVDKKLAEIAAEADAAGDARRAAEARRLVGKAAVASAKLAYQSFLETFSGPRWEALEAQGAQVQRPLWASTSTKNPAYRDVIYVEELIGPQTVNTLPQNTLDAFREHGVVATTLTDKVDDAKAALAALAALGIDMDAVTAQLEVEGVDAFAKSFDALIDAVAAKMAVAGK